MNLKTFQNARKLYLSESLEREENEQVYEFLTTKYNDVLYEGIFSSVMNWFKKNFSPKAAKIRSLGNEYYDWLMQEFNANYKGRDTDSDLKADSDLKDFLKNEKVSSDIEEQINQTAGDSETYQALAKKVILQNKIRAKKEFSSKILGPESPTTKSYSADAARIDKEVDDALSDMSEKAKKDAKKAISLLYDQIVKDGVKKSVASRVSAGIFIFMQVRVQSTELESLQKEYAKAEKILLQKKASYDSLEGAEYLYSVRASKSKKLLDKKTLDPKDILEEIEKMKSALKGIGIDPEKYWGLTHLYIRQITDEEKEKTLEILKKKTENMSDEEKLKLSQDAETKMEEILSDTDDLGKQEKMIDNLEKEISDEKGDKEPTKEEKEKWIKDAEEDIKKLEKEEDTKENQLAILAKKHKIAVWKGDDEEAERIETEREKLKTGKKEEDKSNDAAKAFLENVVEKEKKDSVISGTVKHIAIALTSSVEENGKFFFSDKVSEGSPLRKPELGIANDSGEINSEAIEYVKKTYDVKLDNEDLEKSEIDEAAVKKASESLFSDYKKCVEKWFAEIEKADQKSQEEMRSNKFFAMIFAAKKANVEPLKDDEVYKVCKPAFENYIDIPNE